MSVSKIGVNFLWTIKQTTWKIWIKLYCPWLSWM